jgi:hypothetical protein
MLNKPISLYRGDSSDLVAVRPNITDDTEIISNDWVCRTMLIDENEVELVASRIETIKTADNLHFVVVLSPTDTLTVSIQAGRKYAKVYWVIQLSNNMLTPAYSKESRIEVLVRQQAIVD